MSACGMASWAYLNHGFISNGLGTNMGYIVYSSLKVCDIGAWTFSRLCKFCFIYLEYEKPKTSKFW